MSDETARIIDQEVKAIIEHNYQRARKILEENMDILHSMKDALMKFETIDAPQIDDLMARREVRTPAGWDDAQNGGMKQPPAGSAQNPPPASEDKPSPEFNKNAPSDKPAM